MPENGYLFENYLNTWISDGHWYIRGKCTQSSAYMLNANNFLAELAELFGDDASVYLTRAKLIRQAMQRELWVAEKGIFAEYRDTRGQGLLHDYPELATIYHPSEFGAADEMQVYQMLDWVDRNLKAKEMPGGATMYHTSKWFPNLGRNPSHTTWEFIFAEHLNLAVANYVVGRKEQAYSLIATTYLGIFNGKTPGGLSCHQNPDGKQRGSDEFADSTSMWGRVVYEGLFGIKPKIQNKTINLSPQFPADWDHASIESPLFSYKWQDQNDEVAIDWKSPSAVKVSVRYPIKADRITKVTSNGKKIKFTTSPGIDLTWVEFETKSSSKGRIKISYVAGKDKPVLLKPDKDGKVEFNLTDIKAVNWIDPQGLLTGCSFNDGVLIGKANPSHEDTGIMFASSGNRECPSWLPIRVEPINDGSAQKEPEIWSLPETVKGDLTPWYLVDMSNSFNAPITKVSQQVCDKTPSPEMPAHQGGHKYWTDFVRQDYHGHDFGGVVDTRWREKVGPDSVAWTEDGIPFMTSKEGDNIAVVTLAGGFPEKLRVPINNSGKKLYLMISGITFVNQTHVTQFKLTFEYENSQRITKELVQPFDIGDCWSRGFQIYFDTAKNGFENLAGKQGALGTIHLKDKKPPVRINDTIAHLLVFEMEEGNELKAVSIEAIANDVIFGIMGVSILK